MASAVVTLLLFGVAAEATPITFNFTGTVVGTPSGIFVGQGSAVTGSFSYDSALVDSNPGNGAADFFSSHTAANQLLAFDITITLGALTHSSSNNVNPVGTPHHFLEVLDRFLEDRFRFQAGPIFGPGLQGDDLFLIMLRDFSPVLEPDGVASGSGNLTDTPLTTALDPALFQTCTGLGCFSALRAFNDLGIFEGEFLFRIDSIAKSAPEPTSLALLCLGLAGIRLIRKTPSREFRL